VAVPADSLAVGGDRSRAWDSNDPVCEARRREPVTLSVVSTPFRVPRLAVITLVVTCGLLACSTIPEPGNPPLDPAPLFGSYTSYGRLEEFKSGLPDRSTWQVLSDSASPPRGDCPRFDQFTFAVPAHHLGHDGTLQLEFINDRLLSTTFTPDDFGSYVHALEQSGIKFDATGRATLAPATSLWQSRPNRHAPRFVGWADTRFQSQVNAWISSCS
jgi:hypothetical protein